jgi:hypothetical protein
MSKEVTRLWRLLVFRLCRCKLPFTDTSDDRDQHMLINQDALTYALTTMMESSTDSRSLAILDTESHALMHNQAQKQSMTLFGKLASPRMWTIS